MRKKLNTVFFETGAASRWLLLPLVLVISFACFSQSTARIALVDLSSRDTLYATTLTEGTKHISFACGNRSKKNDAAVLIKMNRSGTFSTVVPLAANALNRYDFSDSTGTIPFFFEGLERPAYIRFSGNPYLETYSKTLTTLTGKQSLDSLQKMNALVNSLYSIYTRFPDAEIVGYHIYYLQQGLGSDFQKNLDAKTSKRWTRMLSGGRGFFYDDARRNSATAVAVNCVSHPPDVLHFQSADSKIDPSLVKGYVHVLVFWATWCGPCKPLMKQLSDLNKTVYGEDSVLFHAVSSESDFKQLLLFFQTHPEYDGLSLFHDSHLCMKTAYQIDHYPTVLIFDRDGKLIARDPETSEIKTIIDTLLLN